MRYITITLCITLAGCFTPVDEIVLRDTRSWSDRDALTVLVANMPNNYRYTDGNVLIAVMPYFPSVVSALNKLQTTTGKWDDSLRYEKLIGLMKDGAGVWIDDAGKLWSGQGDRIRGLADLDSLLICVSLKNRHWPCEPPTVGGIPIMRLSDVPCELPAIDHMADRIGLVNDQGQMIRPRYVGNQVNQELTEDERLFAMFYFDRSVAFLDTQALTLIVYVGEKKYDVPIPLDLANLASK